MFLSSNNRSSAKGPQEDFVINSTLLSVAGDMALRCGRLFAVANTALLSQISTSILRRNLKRNLSKNLAKNLQKLLSYHIHGWEIGCTCCIDNCPYSLQALQPDAPRWATHDAQQTKVLWLLPAQRSVKASWVEFCWLRCFCGWIHCLFVLVITMLISKTLKKKDFFRSSPHWLILFLISLWHSKPV